MNETKSKLSILLPTLNEANNLKKLIPEIISELSHIDKKSYEILVVDDSSTDNTQEIMNSLSAKYENIKLLKRTKKRSLPLSIYDGINSSRFENVMWLDADGSMSASAVKILIDKFLDDPQSVVIGSRFVDGGGYKGIQDAENKSIVKSILNVKDSKDSVLGMIFSIILNKFLNFYLKSEVQDITSGFIVGKKDYLNDKSVFQSSEYGEYFIYLVNNLNLMNINMIEVGYVCETRIYGESKTANSFLQLVRRGIPYIKAVIKCKRVKNENL